MNIEPVKQWLLELQSRICANLIAATEESRYFQDIPWQRESGGGGLTRILENGTVIEKAAVNFSHVTGKELPSSASGRRPEIAGFPFTALGVSVIVHPRNPFAPTSHFNLRFFTTMSPDEDSPVWWFGGGFDLTPYYGFVEDCVHWHRMAKKACDPFGQDLYPHFKQWCDDYFYIRHRKEARGIGGLFFDDFTGESFDHAFGLARSIGEHFDKAYCPIIRNRKDTRWNAAHREFQQYRRGRYVEFNLVYDRGTLFGLQSTGRIESILASLPPAASWRYDWHPEANTPEARLTELFLKPRDWLNFPKTAS